MCDHQPYNDPTLGTATWDAANGYWKIAIRLASGKTANATVTPEDNSIHFSSPELEESRKCIRWVRDNEPELRQYVADKLYNAMLDWHDPEDGTPFSKSQFCDAITLTGILVLEDHRASVIYDDAGCFGGHAIAFTVGADGNVDDEPNLWG